MTTPEGKVKDKTDVWIRKNLPGAYVYKPRGGPFGRAGTPDYFICWFGVFIGIEVKSLTGQVSPVQLGTLKAISHAGGVAAVLRGFDEGRLRAIKAAAIGKMSRELYNRYLQVAGEGGPGPLQSPEEDHRISPS